MPSRDALGTLVEGGDGCYLREILEMVRFQKPVYLKSPSMTWLRPTQLTFASNAYGDGTEWIVDFPDGYTVTRINHRELSVLGDDLEKEAVLLSICFSRGQFWLNDANRIQRVKAQGSRERRNINTGKVHRRMMNGH